MKRISKYISAIMMGAALMAVPSCTDNWNDHYADSDAYTSNETLWQLISSREDLSRFSSIVEKAQFYRDENHPASTTDASGQKVPYTYKDLLSSNATYTLWIPTNDAMTEAEWQKWEQMAGDPNQGYNLQQQFIGNQMSLYRKSMTGDTIYDIRLVNNKIATLNCKNNTFSGISMAVGEDGKKLMNIGAKNGIMHIIDKQNTFQYNVYEYIKFSEDAPSIIKDYLVSRDTTYFMSDGSIEGLPDEDGNPTYVDSVYFNGNMNFRQSSFCASGAGIDDNGAWMNDLKMLNAEINAEDSTFVMIVPTDAAWNTAYSNFQPLYNYASLYPRLDKIKESGSASGKKNINVSTALASYTNGRGHGTVDSLQNVNLMMDIMQPLCFNVNLQRTRTGGQMTAKQFLLGGYKDCDYLINTAGDTIRENDSWKFDQLFPIASQKDTVKASNGYIVRTGKWCMPRNQWMRDVEVECTYNEYDKSLSTLYEVKTLSNETAKDWIYDYGTLVDENYMHVYGKTESTKPYIVFPLTGSRYGTAYPMSGTYELQIVMVPRWYEESGDTAAVEEGKELKNLLKCTVYYWDESCKSAKSYTMNFGSNSKTSAYLTQSSDNIYFDGTKVETIPVMNITFPVTYKNMKNAYPVLKIESIAFPTTEKRYTKDLHSLPFNIDRIILKPVQDEIQ